jgi:hypothetical protein
MNQSNSSIPSKSKSKKREIISSVNVNGSRLELPTRVNKSSSASDIIFLNNKDSFVQVAAGN